MRRNIKMRSFSQWDLVASKLEEKLKKERGFTEEDILKYIYPLCDAYFAGLATLIYQNEVTIELLLNNSNEEADEMEEV